MTKKKSVVSRALADFGGSLELDLCTVSCLLRRGCDDSIRYGRENISLSENGATVTTFDVFY